MGQVCKRQSEERKINFLLLRFSLLPRDPLDTSWRQRGQKFDTSNLRLRNTTDGEQIGIIYVKKVLFNEMHFSKTASFILPPISLKSSFLSRIHYKMSFTCF